MLLRFPIPESAESIDMDVIPVQQASTLKNRKASSCGLGFCDSRTSWRLALLLSLVFLLRVLSPEALVDARVFGDELVASEDGAVVAYVSRSEGTPLLRGSAEVGKQQQQQLQFGDVLGMMRIIGCS